MFRRDDDSVGLSGWLYVDLLLALLVIVLAIQAFTSDDGKKLENYEAENKTLDIQLREKDDELRDLF